MKPLRFIHVSKTGGQAIAFVAIEQAKICWGMFDKEYGTGLACHRLLSQIRNKEIISQHDWFMVVRNPYERMLSVYSWYKEWHKTSDDVNHFLQHSLACIISGKVDVMKRYHEHFIEQWRYLEAEYNIIVLRFERLEEEFNQLMKSRGYNIILNKKVNESKEKLSIDILNADTIRYINQVYEKDFTIFGYNMIH